MKEIKLNKKDWLTNVEMGVIEDYLFCETSAEQYAEMRPYLQSAWAKLVGIDDSLKNPILTCCTECDGSGLISPMNYAEPCTLCDGLGLIKGDGNDKKSTTD